MRYLMLIVYSFFSFIASGQKTETFYDFNWKPCEVGEARYYSTVEKKDSGWLRKDYFISTQKLQMEALYEDKDCKTQNGYCSYYYANGFPLLLGRRIHGKKEGVCREYYSDGMLGDSATYHNGIAIGARLSWHRNGYLSDSISHVNDSTDVHISWFDDGNLASAGLYLYGEKNGKWKFYHRNGQLSGEEVYKKGAVVSKNYFNEDGSSQPDTSLANTPVSFGKNKTAWSSYLLKNLIWPDDYKLTNANSVMIGVSFYINEQGKVEDAEISVPFSDVFDKIALNVIRESPNWKPAIEHNRKVGTRIRQSVTFQQEE